MKCKPLVAGMLVLLMCSRRGSSNSIETKGSSGDALLRGVVRGTKTSSERGTGDGSWFSMIPPWFQAPPDSSGQDLFFFQDLSRQFYEYDWGIELEDSPGMKALKQKMHTQLCDSDTCSVGPSRCITCTRSWWSVLVSGHTNQSKNGAHAVLVRDNGEVAVAPSVTRFENSDTILFDIGVPYAYIPDRLYALAGRLKRFRDATNIRFITTNFACPSDKKDQYVASDVLHIIDSELQEHIAWEGMRSDTNTLL